MMTNRRRVMGGESLPYDAEIEYLEYKEINQSYILTNYFPNQNTEIECVCNLPDVPNSFMICGANINNKKIEFYKWQNTIEYHFNNTFYRPTVIWSNYKGYVTATLRGNDNYSQIIDSDGVILNKQLIPNSGDFAVECPLAIFGLNRNNTVQVYGSGRMKSFKIKENGLLLYDLIPVRIGTTGYMYDKISKQLFGNAGRGAFILGPDVN